MKKNIPTLLIISFSFIVCNLLLPSCDSKQSSQATDTTDSIATNVQAAEQTNTYLSAIDRFLTDDIGKNYTEGDYCVPSYTIVDADEQNAEDILVWGDFWVFNYNLVGDTLKCVAGGSHPGLMHIRKTGNSFEVTAFKQVEDGSRYIPTSKQIFGERYDAFHSINSNEEAREATRTVGLAKFVKDHNLKATMYQDYGWPAKTLR